MGARVLEELIIAVRRERETNFPLAKLILAGDRLAENIAGHCSLKNLTAIGSHYRLAGSPCGVLGTLYCVRSIGRVDDHSLV